MAAVETPTAAVIASKLTASSHGRLSMLFYIYVLLYVVQFLNLAIIYFLMYSFLPELLRAPPLERLW
jgi:hypothetical protein